LLWRPGDTSVSSIVLFLDPVIVILM